MCIVRNRIQQNRLSRLNFLKNHLKIIMKFCEFLKFVLGHLYFILVHVSFNYESDRNLVLLHKPKLLFIFWISKRKRLVQEINENIIWKCFNNLVTHCKSISLANLPVPIGKCNYKKLTNSHQPKKFAENCKTFRWKWSAEVGEIDESEMATCCWETERESEREESKRGAGGIVSVYT